MSCQQKICDQLSVSVSQEELSRPGTARGSAGQRVQGQETGGRRWDLLIFNPILPLIAYVNSQTHGAQLQTSLKGQLHCGSF